MYRLMHFGFAACILSGLGCRPSASIRNASPIASLGAYRTIMVRVGGASQASVFNQDLESTVASQLQRACQFDRITVPREAPTGVDVIADLTIKNAKRDDEGLIQNPNLAIVDVTMVLSDAVQNEILGSAEIRGKSSEIYTGSGIPELQAINAVAGRVADILVSSGCSGPRVATQQPLPVPAPNATNTTNTPAKANADALNDQGKEAFRSGNIAAAKNFFEQAIAAFPDAKYMFNLCLAQDGLKEFKQAMATCQRVVEMNQEERLTQKANERLAIIKEQMNE